MPLRHGRRFGEGAPVSIGLVAPLPPQVGGVASIAGWLLDRQEELCAAYVPFDLWRPPEQEAGGRLTAGGILLQLRLLGRFLRWLPRSPRLVHYTVSYTTTGLLRDLAFVALLRLTRKCVLAHVHGGDLGFDSPRSLRSRLLRGVASLSSELVAISPRGAAALADLGLEARWILNPIRLEPAGFATSSDGDGACRVLFVGTYGDRKGSPELVRAVARARAQGADVSAVLVGKEEHEGEERLLRAVIADLGVEGEIELVPPVKAEELPARYAAADVFCLPSRREGLPMALLEAMAFGLPIVATRVGGVPDLVVDGVSGLLVEPGDVPGLCATIGRLARDPDLRERLGRGARERVYALAAPKIIAGQWRALYEEQARDEANGTLEVSTCA